MHGRIQKAPAHFLQSIVKSWPFRGWAIDIIGDILPHSSQGNRYILVVVDYFTNWSEAITLKGVSQSQIIDFLENNIVYKFRIPETITTDQATNFNGSEVQEYMARFGIKLLNLIPYYAQVNGQVESTNNIIKVAISKMIEDNPREWHIMLERMIWAYRTSRRESTNTTPYELVYGHVVVMPMEINVQS